MQLVRAWKAASPDSPGRVRLVGEVRYEAPSLRPEEYWIEAPEACAGDLSDSGNPWLVWLLPVAVTLGEPLRIALPVDSLLFENAHELMGAWKAWYPELHVVRIEPSGLTRDGPATKGKTAAFFSGGVDSFYAVLHYAYTREPLGLPPIEDLLWLWGFDIRLDRPEAAERMRRRLAGAAAEMARNLVDLRTNLRETTFDRTNWSYVSHGCALAGAALSLEKRYAKALVAASGGYLNMAPWGSHVATDPLLSTANTRIVPYGAGLLRTQRIAFITQFEVVLRTLHVCWRSWSDENCCACGKCIRNMTALELLGVLDRCATFKAHPLTIDRIARAHAESADSQFVARCLADFAAQKGRHDIAAATRKGLRRSAMRARWWKLRRRLEPWLRRRPALLRLAWAVDEWINRNTYY